jgi:hypothetical protein
MWGCTVEENKLEEIKYKPIVQYKAVEGVTDLVVGSSAFVVPLDHVSSIVVNGQPVWTSTIKYVGEDGYFETQNTRYVHVVD